MSRYYIKLVGIVDTKPCYIAFNDEDYAKKIYKMLDNASAVEEFDILSGEDLLEEEPDGEEIGKIINE
jgi:hypothetical protein